MRLENVFLVVLFFVPLGVNAEVTTVTQNDITVTWYPVQDGITHFAYNISVQNLQNANRNISMSTLFSDTSFDISQLQNVKFYEWKNVSSTISVPTYENQSYVYTYVDNATGQDIAETRWSIVQTGTDAKTIYNMQWKPAKMQSFERAARVYKEHMGVMNIPKYGSKEKDGTENGMKWFRLEFDIPLQKLANGWGSSGKAALEIDGYEYHPWWNQSWSYKKQITITNQNTSQVLESGYTVNLTFDHASLVTVGKSLANGNDARVAWYNSSTGNEMELDRINSTPFNTNSVTLLFKTKADMSPSGSDSNYYLYYGNPSAGAPPADGSKVFLVNSYNFNDGGWMVAGSDGTITVAPNGDESKIEFNFPSTADKRYYWNLTSTPITDFIAKFMIRTNQSQDSDFLVGFTGEEGTTDVYSGGAPYYSNAVMLRHYWAGTNSHHFRLRNAIGGTHIPNSDDTFVYAGTINTDYYLTLSRLGTTTELKVYSDSARTNLLGSGSYVMSSAPAMKYFYAIMGQNRNTVYGTLQGWVDNFVEVRKYLSPEPTTSIGPEETRSPPQNITMGNSTYTPSYGDVGETFSFTIDVNNSQGDNVSATLFINNASVGSDVVSWNGTASIQWIPTSAGTSTYFWNATNLGENRTGRYPATGEATGPVVYEPSYKKSISVPNGASKLMCTAIWAGLYNTSGVTVALVNPSGTLYQEFDSDTTTRKKITETIIPLPGLANYNITRYDGLTKLSISSPAQGTWTFKVMNTNVTSFEADVEIG